MNINAAHGGGGKEPVPSAAPEDFACCRTGHIEGLEKQVSVPRLVRQRGPRVVTRYVTTDASLSDRRRAPRLLTATRRRADLRRP